MIAENLMDLAASLSEVEAEVSDCTEEAQAEEIAALRVRLRRADECNERLARACCERNQEVSDLHFQLENYNVQG
jgi:hypothetical protein